MSWVATAPEGRSTPTPDDLKAITDEELLRQLWQQADDFSERRKIRARMYKLREERLREMVQNDEESLGALSTAEEGDSDKMERSEAQLSVQDDSASTPSQRKSNIQVTMHVEGDSAVTDTIKTQNVRLGSLTVRGVKSSKTGGASDQEIIQERMSQASTERKARYQKILGELDEESKGDPLMSITKTTYSIQSDALAGEGYLSMKHKEVRDSVSPTRAIYRRHSPADDLTSDEEAALQAESENVIEAIKNSTTTPSRKTSKDEKSTHKTSKGKQSEIPVRKEAARKISERKPSKELDFSASRRTDKASPTSPSKKLPEENPSRSLRKVSGQKDTPTSPTRQSARKISGKNTRVTGGSSKGGKEDVAYEIEASAIEELNKLDAYLGASIDSEDQIVSEVEEESLDESGNAIKVVVQTLRRKDGSEYIARRVARTARLVSREEDIGEILVGNPDHEVIERNISEETTEDGNKIKIITETRRRPDGIEYTTKNILKTSKIFDYDHPEDIAFSEDDELIATNKAEETDEQGGLIRTVTETRRKKNGLEYVTKKVYHISKVTIKITPSDDDEILDSTETEEKQEDGSMLKTVTEKRRTKSGIEYTHRQVFRSRKMTLSGVDVGKGLPMINNEDEIIDKKETEEDDGNGGTVKVVTETRRRKDGSTYSFEYILRSFRGSESNLNDFPTGGKGSSSISVSVDDKLLKEDVKEEVQEDGSVIKTITERRRAKDGTEYLRHCVMHIPKMPEAKLQVGSLEDEVLEENVNEEVLEDGTRMRSVTERRRSSASGLQYTLRRLSKTYQQATHPVDVPESSILDENITEEETDDGTVVKTVIRRLQRQDGSVYTTHNVLKTFTGPTNINLIGWEDDELLDTAVDEQRTRDGHVIKTITETRRRADGVQYTIERSEKALEFPASTRFSSKGRIQLQHEVRRFPNDTVISHEEHEETEGEGGLIKTAVQVLRREDGSEYTTKTVLRSLPLLVPERETSFVVIKQEFPQDESGTYPSLDDEVIYTRKREEADEEGNPVTVVIETRQSKVTGEKYNITKKIHTTDVIVTEEGEKVISSAAVDVKKPRPGNPHGSDGVSSGSVAALKSKFTTPKKSGDLAGKSLRPDRVNTASKKKFFEDAVKTSAKTSPAKTPKRTNVEDRKKTFETKNTISADVTRSKPSVEVRLRLDKNEAFVEKVSSHNVNVEARRGYKDSNKTSPKPVDADKSRKTQEERKASPERKKRAQEGMENGLDYVDRSKHKDLKSDDVKKENKTETRDNVTAKVANTKKNVGSGAASSNVTAIKAQHQDTDETIKRKTESSTKHKEARPTKSAETSPRRKTESPSHKVSPPSTRKSPREVESPPKKASPPRRDTSDKPKPGNISPQRVPSSPRRGRSPLRSGVSGSREDTPSRGRQCCRKAAEIAKNASTGNAKPSFRFTAKKSTSPEEKPKINGDAKRSALKSNGDVTRKLQESRDKISKAEPKKTGRTSPPSPRQPNRDITVKRPSAKSPEKIKPTTPTVSTADTKKSGSLGKDLKPSSQVSEGVITIPQTPSVEDTTSYPGTESPLIEDVSSRSDLPYHSLHRPSLVREPSEYEKHDQTTLQGDMEDHLTRTDKLDAIATTKKEKQHAAKQFQNTDLHTSRLTNGFHSDDKTKRTTELPDIPASLASQVIPTDAPLPSKDQVKGTQKYLTAEEKKEKPARKISVDTADTVSARRSLFEKGHRRPSGTTKQKPETKWSKRHGSPSKPKEETRIPVNEPIIVPKYIHPLGIDDEAEVSPSSARLVKSAMASTTSTEIRRTSETRDILVHSFEDLDIKGEVRSFSSKESSPEPPSKEGSPAPFSKEGSPSRFMTGKPIDQGVDRNKLRRLERAGSNKKLLEDLEVSRDDLPEYLRNIESIFNLSILEAVLEKAETYEERRIIRGQIRTAKKAGQTSSSKSTFSTYKRFVDLSPSKPSTVTSQQATLKAEEEADKSSEAKRTSKYISAADESKKQQKEQATKGLKDSKDLSRTETAEDSGLGGSQKKLLSKFETKQSQTLTSAAKAKVEKDSSKTYRQQSSVKTSAKVAEATVSTKGAADREADPKRIEKRVSEKSLKTTPKRDGEKSSEPKGILRDQEQPGEDIEEPFSEPLRHQKSLNRTPSQAQTDVEKIVSPYGVGPTDENGMPLFGLRALKKRNTETSLQEESAVQKSATLSAKQSSTVESSFKKESSSVEEKVDLHRITPRSMEEISPSLVRTMRDSFKQKQEPAEKPREVVKPSAKLRDSFIKEDSDGISDAEDEETTLIDKRSCALQEIIKLHEAKVTETPQTGDQERTKPKQRLRENFESTADVTDVKAHKTWNVEADLTTRSQELRNIIEKHEIITQETTKSTTKTEKKLAGILKKPSSMSIVPSKAEVPQSSASEMPRSSDDLYSALTEEQISSLSKEFDLRAQDDGVIKAVSVTQEEKSRRGKESVDKLQSLERKTSYTEIKLSQPSTDGNVSTSKQEVIDRKTGTKLTKAVHSTQKHLKTISESTVSSTSKKTRAKKLVTSTSSSSSSSSSSSDSSSSEDETRERVGKTKEKRQKQYRKYSKTATKKKTPIKVKGEDKKDKQKQSEKETERETSLPLAKDESLETTHVTAQKKLSKVVMERKVATEATAKEKIETAKGEAATSGIKSKPIKAGKRGKKETEQPAPKTAVKSFDALKKAEEELKSVKLLSKASKLSVGAVDTKAQGQVTKNIMEEEMQPTSAKKEITEDALKAPKKVLEVLKKSTDQDRKPKASKPEPAEIESKEPVSPVFKRTFDRTTADVLVQDAHVKDVTSIQRTERSLKTSADLKKLGKAIIDDKREVSITYKETRDKKGEGSDVTENLKTQINKKSEMEAVNAVKSKPFRAVEEAVKSSKVKDRHRSEKTGDSLSSHEKLDTSIKTASISQKTQEVSGVKVSSKKSKLISDTSEVDSVSTIRTVAEDRTSDKCRSSLDTSRDRTSPVKKTTEQLGKSNAPKVTHEALQKTSVTSQIASGATKSKRTISEERRVTTKSAVHALKRSHDSLVKKSGTLEKKTDGVEEIVITTSETKSDKSRTSKETKISSKKHLSSDKISVTSDYSKEKTERLKQRVGTSSEKPEELQKKSYISKSTTAKSKSELSKGTTTALTRELELQDTGLSLSKTDMPSKAEAKISAEKSYTPKELAGTPKIETESSEAKTSVSDEKSLCLTKTSKSSKERTDTLKDKSDQPKQAPDTSKEKAYILEEKSKSLKERSEIYLTVKEKSDAQKDISHVTKQREIQKEKPYLLKEKSDVSLKKPDAPETISLDLRISSDLSKQETGFQKEIIQPPKETPVKPKEMPGASHIRPSSKSKEEGMATKESSEITKESTGFSTDTSVSTSKNKADSTADKSGTSHEETDISKVKTSTSKTISNVLTKRSDTLKDKSDIHTAVSHGELSHFSDEKSVKPAKEPDSSRVKVDTSKTKHVTSKEDHEISKSKSAVSSESAILKDSFTGVKALADTVKDKPSPSTKSSAALDEKLDTLNIETSEKSATSSADTYNLLKKKFEYKNTLDITLKRDDEQKEILQRSDQTGFSDDRLKRPEQKLDEKVEHTHSESEIAAKTTVLKSAADAAEVLKTESHEVTKHKSRIPRKLETFIDGSHKKPDSSKAQMEQSERAEQVARSNIEKETDKETEHLHAELTETSTGKSEYFNRESGATVKASLSKVKSDDTTTKLVTAVGKSVSSSEKTETALSKVDGLKEKTEAVDKFQAEVAKGISETSTDKTVTSQDITDMPKTQGDSQKARQRKFKEASTTLTLTETTASEQNISAMKPETFAKKDHTSEDNLGLLNAGGRKQDVEKKQLGTSKVKHEGAARKPEISSIKPVNLETRTESLKESSDIRTQKRDTYRKTEHASKERTDASKAVTELSSKIKESFSQQPRKSATPAKEAEVSKSKTEETKAIRKAFVEQEKTYIIKDEGEASKKVKEDYKMVAETDRIKEASHYERVGPHKEGTTILKQKEHADMRGLDISRKGRASAEKVGSFKETSESQQKQTSVSKESHSRSDIFKDSSRSVISSSKQTGQSPPVKRDKISVITPGKSSFKELTDDSKTKSPAIPEGGKPMKHVRKLTKSRRISTDISPRPRLSPQKETRSKTQSLPSLSGDSLPSYLQPRRVSHSCYRRAATEEELKHVEDLLLHSYMYTRCTKRVSRSSVTYDYMYKVTQDGGAAGGDGLYSVYFGPKERPQMAKDHLKQPISTPASQSSSLESRSVDVSSDKMDKVHSQHETSLERSIEEGKYHTEVECARELQKTIVTGLSPDLASSEDKLVKTSDLTMESKSLKKDSQEISLLEYRDSEGKSSDAGKTSVHCGLHTLPVLCHKETDTDKTYADRPFVRADPKGESAYSDERYDKTSKKSSSLEQHEIKHLDSSKESGERLSLIALPSSDITRSDSSYVQSKEFLEASDKEFLSTSEEKQKSHFDIVRSSQSMHSQQTSSDYEYVQESQHYQTSSQQASSKYDIYAVTKEYQQCTDSGEIEITPKHDEVVHHTHTIEGRPHTNIGDKLREGDIVQSPLLACSSELEQAFLDRSQMARLDRESVTTQEESSKALRFDVQRSSSATVNTTADSFSTSQSPKQLQIHQRQEDISGRETARSEEMIAGRSFLDDRSKVTGINDVLNRMGATDAVDLEAKVTSDEEAKSLLNRFLGAQVLMSGVESMMASTSMAESSRAATEESGEVTVTKEASGKASRSITKDGQTVEQSSASFSTGPQKFTLSAKSQQEGAAEPVIIQGLDVNRIDDEVALNQLLDSCDEYEDRRRIRMRLKSLVADKKALQRELEGHEIGQREASKRDTGLGSDSKSRSTTSNERECDLRSSEGDSGSKPSTFHSTRTETSGTSEVTAHKSSSYSSSSSKVTSQQTSTKKEKETGISPFEKFKQLDAQQTKPATNAKASVAGGGPLFKFSSSLSRSASGVKDMILQWCQCRTRGYKGVNIENFSTSWNDGLAFCALIHHFYPDAFDFDKLNPKNRRYNFDLAFRVADERAGIMALLDVDDMVMMPKPDWKSVFTYVQSMYRRLKDE